MSALYVGMTVPPFSMDVVQGLSGIDLSTTSAAELRIRKPGLTPSSAPRDVTWAAATSGPTAKRITLTHTLVAGDLDVRGMYFLYARVQIGGVWYRTTTFSRFVFSEFEVPT